MEYVKIPLLLSKIVHPPRDTLLYLKNRKKQIENWRKFSDKILKLIIDTESKEDFDSFMEDALGSSDKYLPEEIKWVLEKLNKTFKDLLSDIDNIIKYGGDPVYGPKFMGYLVSLLQGIETESFISEMNRIKDVLVEKKERMGNVFKDEYWEDEGIDIKPWFRILTDTKILFEEFSIDDFNEKMSELQKLRLMEQYEDKGYKPKTEDIETLYHATAYAKDILRSGFKKEMPAGNVGLGGKDFEKRISFTSDLYIAKEISRALKEAIMIARNELKWKQILDWMKKEHIDPKKCPYKIPPENLGDVFDLYRCYLALSKIRSNPVFFNDSVKVMKELSQKKSSDVGILKCQVKVTHPKVKYMKGEREFRVPPEAVIKIEKL